MVPRDRNMNFSALIYQNLGTTLAPITGLQGSFVPAGNALRRGTKDMSYSCRRAASGSIRDARLAGA